VLVSPHFLFRVEHDPPNAKPGSIIPVSDLQLASRLSYFLWSSMPDEELLTLAESGELRKEDKLHKQVRRMLKDPKSNALAKNFAGQWLEIRRLNNLTPDKNTYPAFDQALRDAMLTETEMFFTAIIAEDRSLLEFLDADYTYLNERLAKHYGIDGITGDHFRRVSLRSDSAADAAMRARRGGILTHASILSVTSNPTRTSPVKRGKWVLDNILGTPPADPPPNVPELKDGEKQQLSGSLKQRLEQHRSNAACASCHREMDPIGFGLENFDGIGAWREKDGKHEIDAAGKLSGGRKFDGPAQLRQILQASQQQFIRCLSERMLTYALGRGVEESDEGTVMRIAQQVEKNEFRFTSLVLAIVDSPPFQMQRVPEKH
ncbi:MAG: DUF1592 domain-containing protein, partial [Planctomycetota bacterium]|nr:DUF1592 domain-containing protein [Planctomycetota bacterium]